MQTSRTTINDLDVSKISFGKLNKLSTGISFMNVLYENKQLSIKFGSKSEMYRIPFGSTIKRNPETGDLSAYNIEMSVPHESEQHKILKNLEDKVIKHILENAVSILKDPEATERDVRKSMKTPLLQYSYIKGTKDIMTDSSGTPYDPRIRNKCRVSKNGGFSCQFYNGNVSRNTPLNVETDEHSFPELIPKQSDARVQTRVSVWIGGTGTWGFACDLEKIMFYPRVVETGNTLLDSDEEREEDELPDQTEVEVSSSGSAGPGVVSDPEPSHSPKETVSDSSSESENETADAPDPIPTPASAPVPVESDSDSSSDSDVEPVKKKPPTRGKTAAKTTTKKSLMEALKA